MRSDYILAVDAKAFLQQLNALRSGPKQFAELIRKKYLNMLDNFYCHRLTLRQYAEGKTALGDAVKVLESNPQLPALTFDAGLCVAAHIQAKSRLTKKVFGEQRACQVIENVRRFAKIADGAPLADCNVTVQNLTMRIFSSTSV